jgi:hypothetical protein
MWASLKVEVYKTNLLHLEEPKSNNIRCKIIGIYWKNSTELTPTRFAGTLNASFLVINFSMSGEFL